MMYIEINVTDEKFIPGKKLSENYPSEYGEEFARYMARVLKKEYKKAIDKQRYSYKWKPLSVPYMKYKKAHNLSLKTWEATGLLYKSIVYRKRNGKYYVGIDPYKRYPNGGPKVIDIAKIMEYGSRKNPARPLFRPLFSYIRKNIGRYWKKFLKDEKGIII
jgi:hypothetical protein